MKLFRKISLLCLGIFVAFSCSSEDSGSAPSGDNNSLLADINITASTTDGDELLVTDSGDLRLAQNVGTDGKTTTPAMNEKNLNVRVVVTRSGGTPQHQTLVFTKTAGQARATYSGQIKVPANGTGNYTISAIVLNEVRGEVFTTLDTRTNRVNVSAASALAVASNSVVKTKIPYMATGQTLFLDTSGRTLRPVSITFKPSGTLLRMQLVNTTGKQQIFNKIRVKTNAFVGSWYYDFTKLTTDNLLAGGASALTYDKTFTIPQVTLASGATHAPYYYLWVMPTKLTSGLKTEIFVGNTANENFLAFDRTSSVKAGGVRIALQPQQQPVSTVGVVPPGVFPGNKLPLAWVPTQNGIAQVLQNYQAPYQLFTATSDNAYRVISGSIPAGDVRNIRIYYTQNQVNTIFPTFPNGGSANITIDGKRYFLPGEKEVRAVFPTTEAYTWDYVHTFTETVRFPGATTDFTGTTEFILRNGADNKRSSAYFLRFKGANGDNSKLTAYKVERVGTNMTNADPLRVGYYFKITARYLGTALASTTLTQLEDPAFWSSNNANDVSVMLPTLGNGDGSNHMHAGLGGGAIFWSSFRGTNPDDVYQRYYYSVGHYWGTWWNYDAYGETYNGLRDTNKVYSYPIIPFLRP